MEDNVAAETLGHTHAMMPLGARSVSRQNHDVSGTDISSAFESLKRNLECAAGAGDGNSDMSRKSKRNKLLIPSDREAYYAIVSLLIDNSRIPSDVRELTGANCEEFVPAEDLIILDVLKKVLRYDCE